MRTKLIIEGTIEEIRSFINNPSQHGLTDTTQTAIDVVGQGAENLCVKVSNPSADTQSQVKKSDPFDSAMEGLVKKTYSKEKL